MCFSRNNYTEVELLDWGKQDFKIFIGLRNLPQTYTPNLLPTYNYNVSISLHVA